MLEKSLHYRYRTYDNFAKAVQAGNTTWEAVEADSETLRKDHNTAKSGTDEWGFQSISRSQLLLANGSATTTQCRRAFRLERAATSFLDNHVNHTKKRSKPMVPSTRNLDEDVSLLDDAKPAQPASPAPTQYKRQYTKRIGTPASSVKHNKRTVLDAQAFQKQVHKQALRLAQRELGVQANHDTLQSTDTAMEILRKSSTHVGSSASIEDVGISSSSAAPDNQASHARKRVLSEEPDSMPQAKRPRLHNAQMQPFAAQVSERASTIGRELLSLSRPGIYIMPPGARPPAMGRPRNMLIVVWKSGRLQEKEWFLQASEDIPNIVRDTPPEANELAAPDVPSKPRSEEAVEQLVSNSPLHVAEPSRHDMPLPHASSPHVSAEQTMPAVAPASLPPVAFTPASLAPVPFEGITAMESPTGRPAKRQRRLPRRFEPEDADVDFIPDRRSIGRPRREHYIHTPEGLQKLIQSPVTATSQSGTTTDSNEAEHAVITNANQTKAPDMLVSCVQSTPVPRTILQPAKSPKPTGLLGNNTESPSMILLNTGALSAVASVAETEHPAAVSELHARSETNPVPRSAQRAMSDGPSISARAPDLTRLPGPVPNQVCPQDAMVQLLAKRAAEDPSLEPLMRVVATGRASAEQLAQFRIVTDELKAIVEVQPRLHKVQEVEGSARPFTVANSSDRRSMGESQVDNIEMGTAKHGQAGGQVQTTRSQRVELPPILSSSTAQPEASVLPHRKQGADHVMGQPLSAVSYDPSRAEPHAGTDNLVEMPTIMDRDKSIKQQKPELPLPELIVLGEQGVCDTGSPQKSRRIQYKQGVRLSAGMIGQKRTQTVMNIVTQARGSYPADREMFYAYITEWRKHDSNVRPDVQTVKRAVKSLVDSGKLIKITFAFADKEGKATKKHIVILPGIKVTSKVVQDLQKSMVTAYPSLCFPSEVEIDTSLLTGVFKDELPADYVPKMHDSIVHVAERPSPPPKKRRVRISSNTAGQPQHDSIYEPAWKKWARDQKVEGVEPAYAPDSDDEALAEETSEAQLNMQTELQVDSYSHDAEAMPPKARPGRKLAMTHNWLQKAEAAKKDKLKKDAIRAAQEQAMTEQLAHHAKLAELRKRTSAPQANLKAADQVVDYFSSRGFGQQYTTGLQIVQEMAGANHLRRKSDTDGHASDSRRVSGSDARSSTPHASMGKPINPYNYIWPSGKSRPGRHPALENVTSLTDPGQKFHATTGTFGTDFFDIRASQTARPKLKLQIDDYSKWEAKIPSSLQDMLRGRRGSNAKSPKHGMTLTYDFDQEINKVANWEKQHEKDLTGRMSLVNLRFINHVIPSEVAAQTIWFSKPQDIGRPVRARNSRAVPVQVSRWVPPPPASPAAPLPVSVSQWKSTAISASPRPGTSNTQPAPVTRSLLPPSYAAFPGTGVLMPTPASSYPDLPYPVARTSGPWPATPARTSASIKTPQKQPESISESVESRPATRRGKKPGRRAVAMSSIFKPTDVQRLIASVLCVRMLIGGLEQQINWHIVEQLMPDHELPLIKARWAEIESCQFLQLVKLDEQLQEVFIAAYEQGRLDSLNYSKLESYDWDTLVVWIIEALNIVAEEKISELPTSRRALNGLDITDNTMSRSFVKDEYYRDLATQMRRTEIVHDISFSLTISKQSPIAQPYFGDALAIARSHVRANNATPAESYDSTAARVKLERLFTEPSLDTAIKFLTTNGIMTRLSKGRVIPGRNYAISDLVFKNLKRHALDLPMLHAAARGKWNLDMSFAREGRMRMSQVTPDGEVMMLLNLAAAGRIRFEVDLPPSTADPAIKPLDAETGKRHLSVWGFTEGNYKTTQMDRQNIVFDVWLVPTKEYVRGVPLPNPLPPPPAPHLADVRHPVPFWYDIHDRLVPPIWEALVAAVLGAVTIQSGCSVEDMRNMFRGAVEVWDLELVLDWLERLGVIRGSGVNGSGKGYVAKEWWWSVLGGGPGGRE